MSQPISVSVQMDAASFHDFAAFDLLRHRKAWHRPLAFTAILLASAGVCLSQVGQKDGAALLTVVLSVVALGVPAVYFWTFFHSLRLQIKKMGLPRPFYRLTLDDAGLSVWMAGEQDKPEPTRSYPWHDLHLAYRTPFLSANACAASFACCFSSSVREIPYSSACCRIRSSFSIVSRDCSLNVSPVVFPSSPSLSYISDGICIPYIEYILE